jgi:hypothetical protein
MMVTIQWRKSWVFFVRERDEKEKWGKTYGSSRGVEGFVGAPESAEGEETLLAELLIETGVRKADGEHVTQVAEGHENGQAAGGSAVTKHVPEEYTGDDNVRGSEVGLGDGSEVGDVGQDVKNGHATDSQGSRNGQGAAGILNLAEDVVCVLPALVAVDDVE